MVHRRGTATFRSFESSEEYRAAKATYASAFWKGRFAVDMPDEAGHQNASLRECADRPTWRLVRETYDLVQRRGPNEWAGAERKWAVEQLAGFEVKQPPSK